MIRPTTAELVTAGAARIAPVSGTPKLDAELLLGHATGWRRSSLLAWPARMPDAPAVETYEQLIARRSLGEPLAYLTGTREFFSLALAVGPAVLVPRPETEGLVAELLGEAAPNARVLDYGTGSGAIAIALAHERPDLDVTAIDVSPAALEVARANAARFGLSIAFVASDGFAALGSARFDWIVANPPYVQSDRAACGELAFEPRGALDGGADGLDAIRVLVAAAPAHLRAGGRLVIEHGNDQQASVAKLGAAAGFELASVHADLAGHDRFVVLRR